MRLSPGTLCDPLRNSSRCLVKIDGLPFLVEINQGLVKVVGLINTGVLTQMAPHKIMGASLSECIHLPTHRLNQLLKFKE